MATAEEVARRLRQNKSVLDYVLADAQALVARASARATSTKLDEYLTGVRELEMRMHGRARGPDLRAGRAARERPRLIPSTCS